MVRASVPKLTLDEVFETKEEIARAVKDELEKVSEFLDETREVYTYSLGHGRVWL